VKITGQQFERLITLDLEGADLETRRFPAALSSETPVPRYFGNEVLQHTREAADLSRAVEGLPLLWNHNSDQPIGRVNRICLEDGKLRGDLHFSGNPKATEVFTDVRDGFLKDLSIGYRIDRYEERGDTVLVTGWTLLEASIVTVPADASVGIGRSAHYPHEDIVMTDEVKPDTGAETTSNVVNLDQERHSAIVGERQRIASLQPVFAGRMAQMDAALSALLHQQAIESGWSAELARAKLLEALDAQSAPIMDHGRQADAPLTRAAKPGNQPQTVADVRITDDAMDKFKRGAEQALLVRSAMVVDREQSRVAREGGLAGKSLRSLAADYLRLHGVDTAKLSDENVATRAFNTGMMQRASGMTTSDFTNILANVANKSLLMGWDEAPETWSMWTRRGSLPDFKQAEISGLSGFTGLDAVPEDGDISYGKFTDRKETIKLVQYAKKFRMSRQLIINDDLNALAAVPRGMGRAANRKVGDITYALLDGTGPTLNQDSTALWNTASHKNYVAAATAPTVATLTTATTAMAKQTDPNTSAVLNIRARYLLVPVALETTARVLVASMYDPAGTAGTLPPNPFANRFEVVTDARLDGQTNGTAAWYLLGDPGVFDTVEVAFLNGQSEPYMRENADWTGQGVEYVVGVDFGVSALDFRAMHKYKGTT
jgi:HK97 family phage prohead protease